MTNQPNNYSLKCRGFFICYLFAFLLVPACSLLPGGISPESAVRETFSEPGFRIASVRNLKEGAVVLYHKPEPNRIAGSSEPDYQFGFSFVERRDGRWWTRSGRSGSFSPEKGARAVFLVSAVQTSDHDPKQNPGDSSEPLMVFGKILDQSITSIELVKNSSQTEEAVPSDSMFAFLVIDGSLPCTLRFLDHRRTVLEEYHLTSLGEWQISPEHIERIKLTCSVRNEP